MDLTVFRNVGTFNSYAEESPKRKNITFRICENLKTKISEIDGLMWEIKVKKKYIVT